jgi:hypothetical protein
MGEWQVKFRWKWFIAGFVGFQIILFPLLCSFPGTWQNKAVMYFTGKK